jgi:hypothetical protein
MHLIANKHIDKNIQGLLSFHHIVLTRFCGYLLVSVPR